MGDKYIAYQFEDISTTVAQDAVLEPKIKLDVKVSDIKNTVATINWTASSNIEGDVIVSATLRRAGEKEFVELEHAKEGSYKLTRLNPDSIYDYVLTFMTESGAQAQFSVTFETGTKSMKRMPKTAVIGMSW